MAVIAMLSAPFGSAHLQPYQKTRLASFFSGQSDSARAGYNTKQAAIAIGSGGLFGQGLGQGSQSQLNFLPVAHTDFIFAGLSEATGLVGATIVLVLYLIFIYRVFQVAELARDDFGSYLALGVALMFIVQIIINIGMNLGMLPVTGIPLPFISFGGTSLIVSLVSVGLLESIYVRHKKISF